jgi:uncharacterized protein (DUF927 family)
LAGRRSIDETNKIRASLGLSVIPKKRGRPPKSTAILPESKKAQAQVVLAKMLGSKGKEVVNKILSKALDDNDDDQMACLKLVAERIIPTSYFEKAKGGSNGISIQIIGVEATNVISNDDEAIDAEFEESNEE